MFKKFVLRNALLTIFMAGMTNALSAAEKVSLTTDTLKNVEGLKPEEKYPKLKVQGLFQARYMAGFDKHVDVYGMHHADGAVSRNAFDLQKVRVQMAAKIGPHTEVTTLVNLAEFKSDPKGKVLETASIKYTVNEKLAFTFGQFRPWFGIEETYPLDFVKSFDFSNQYYEFGKNGWTSFQTGASVGGTLGLGKIPLQYAVSVVNGNGKTQNGDKDNGKQVMGRFVFGLSQKNGLNLGLNAGTGKVFDHSVYALGADITGTVHLSDKWYLDMQAEAKQGVNHSLYYSIPTEQRPDDIRQFMTRGIYVLPNLRYNVGQPRLNSVELSCRYEYLDLNYKNLSNPRQTLTPMVSLELLKSYNARIELGMQIDRSKHAVVNTTNYNNNLFILQLQTRF